jgi:hypothetical protein
MSTGKIIFYVVAFFFVTNALGYFFTQQFKSFLALLLIPLVASTFTKSRVWQMVSGIVGTILLASFFPRLTEGMENVADAVESKVDASKTSSTSTLPTPANAKPIQTEAKAKEEKLEESVEPARKKGEPVGVDSVDLSAMSKTGKSGKNNRIDYASTIESAYSQLQDTLGKDGLKKLTGDTHELINKQKELFETMQGMTPMLNQAMEMLQGMDLKSLKQMATSASPI